MKKQMILASICILIFNISNANEVLVGNQKKPFTKSQAEEAAKLLISARKQNELIELPNMVKPNTLEEGYIVQDQIIKNIGIPLIGWKIAITSDDLMKKAGVSEPVSGPLFSQWAHPEPQTINNGSPTLYGFEFEFAFRMAETLPSRQEPYSKEEVKAAIGSMHLAIEPVGTRYTQGPVKSGLAQFAADHGGNFGFVYGPPIKDWQSIELANVMVTGYMNDKKVGENLGKNVMGDPLNSITWLANHLQKRGYALKAGEWVTTGAVVGPVPAAPPIKVRGHFGSLGSVHVNFED